MCRQSPAIYCLFLVLFGAPGVLAERPLREVTSANKRFVLKVDPGRPGRMARACQATLSEQLAERRRGRRVWQANLVNDVAPVYAAIRDDGRFVVTLDEHNRGGARHALVIYGENGQLLRHFLLQDLLQNDEWKHVKARKRALEWLKDPELRFDDKHDHFVVKLDQQRSLRIDLKTLQVVRGKPEDDLAAYASMPPELLMLLLGHLDEPGEQVIAERLKEVAAATPEQQAETDVVVDALVAEEAPAGLDELAVMDPNQPQTPDEIADRVADPNMAAEMAVADPNVAGPEPPIEPNEPRGIHNPRMTGGFEIPAPDLLGKTNYVQWINDLGQVTGPDAAPLYTAATELYEPGTNDQRALLSNALAGDPNALYSDAFANWLAANDEALAAFRDAAQLPACSWHFDPPPDDAMIGVMLPQLSPLRTLSKGCIAAGHLALSAGDPESAAAAYLDAAAAGAHVGRRATLIENLVGMSMQSLAADAMFDLHSSPAAEQADWVALAEEAELAMVPVRSPIEAVQMERAFYLDTVQRLWNEDAATGERMLNADWARKVAGMVSMPGDDVYTEKMLTSLAETNYEESVEFGNAYFDAVTEAMTLPYAEASARLRELERLMASDDTGHVALRDLTPALSSYHFSATRAESNRRAALLVNHLRAWQQAHGQLPSSLDVFAERDFAVDPFSNTRFMYRRAGDDFVLYSTGGNATDDGGIHDHQGRDNDLVYWPRPVPAP